MAESEIPPNGPGPADLHVQDHLELVADVTRAFASSLDINATLADAMRRIMNYLDAEAASIFLLENEDTKLVCHACAGPVKITGLCLAADQGIVGKAVRENTVQIVRDARNNPDFATVVDKETGFATRSVLCAPLSVKEQRIGALELINKRTGSGLFDTRDQHLLTTLASGAALAIHNAAMARALVEQERIQRELELAGEIQRNLLPAPEAADFPVHGINLPVREVSGDFYDYLELDDGRICFNLADVSGKGMNAALLMAKTSSLYHCLAKTIPEPGQLLGVLNNEILENSTRGMFVTMIGGILDPSTGSLHIANAGHQPALLTNGSGEFTEIPADAPPLGIVPDVIYTETALSLNSGSLYLYSDGITEARTPTGGELGLGGLLQLLRAMARLPAAERLERLVTNLQQQAAAIHDDMTVLLVEVSR